MDYAQRQRDPTRHVIGIGFVILVHALVIWALMTGLGTKMIEVIKKPLNATIIEEVKLPPPPPPPPPKKIVEAPKIQQPVQPYIPPPDIPVPTQSEPVISAVTPTPPTEPVVIAPPPVVIAPPAPPAPPKPAVRKGISRVAGDDPTYPKEAIRNGVQSGRVVVRLNIDEKGNVTGMTFVVSEPPRVFEKAVRNALMDWKFSADGEKYVGEVEINFTLKD